MKHEAQIQKPAITVRFDIDTIACLNRGVPELLKIADEEEVKFTFFVNMGRAVGYGPVIKRLISRQLQDDSEPKAMHFSPMKKLGLIDWLKTVALNPRVGLGGAENLRKIVSSGHDLGLHGGRNHGLWHHCSDTWTSEELMSELDWGIQAMLSCGLPQPRMFASPGFSSPDLLPKVLWQKEFKIIADEHHQNSPIINDKSHETHGLVQAFTGLLGEPGGVGFFENWMAEGKSETEMRPLLNKILTGNQPFMCYDHPAFTSGEGKILFRSFIRNFKRMGGTFLKLSSVIETPTDH